MRRDDNLHAAPHHAEQHFVPYGTTPPSHVTPPTHTSPYPPHLGSLPSLSPSLPPYAPTTPATPTDNRHTPPMLPTCALPSIVAAVGSAAGPVQPNTSSAGSEGPDLSTISRGPLDVPKDYPDFVMSSDLQVALRQATPAEALSLHDRVIKEATSYANDRKGVVRDALKRKQNNANIELSPIDKGKLRSRREAKVHRVKERCFEKALKDAIQWFIEERAQDNITNRTPRNRQVPVLSQSLLQHDSRSPPLLLPEVQALQFPRSQSHSLINQQRQHLQSNVGPPYEQVQIPRVIRHHRS